MPMTDHHIPRHAAHIWLSGEGLSLGLSGATGVANVIHLPDTPAGLTLALSILRSRIAGDLRIGNPGDPTQWAIDRQLKKAPKLTTLTINDLDTLKL